MQWRLAQSSEARQAKAAVVIIWVETEHANWRVPIFFLLSVEVTGEKGACTASDGWSGLFFFFLSHDLKTIPQLRRLISGPAKNRNTINGIVLQPTTFKATCLRIALYRNQTGGNKNPRYIRSRTISGLIINSAHCIHVRLLKVIIVRFCVSIKHGRQRNNFCWFLQRFVVIVKVSPMFFHWSHLFYTLALSKPIYCP